MNQKTKCIKCGLLIDDDVKYCPYCGHPQQSEESEKSATSFEQTENNTESKSQEATQEQKQENTIAIEQKPIKFFDFPTKANNFNVIKMLLYFIIGLIGINALGMIYRAIIGALDNAYFAYTTQGSASVNFSLYLIIFGTFLCIANKDIIDCFKNLNKFSKWAQGFGFGFLLLVVSAAVSALMMLFYDGGVNNNETGVRSITEVYPLLPILIMGIIGPFVEEFTYRVGLFNLVRRWNRYVAYIATAIIFGLIHFDFASTDMLNEFMNLPSYIVSGLMLCYFYDYGGFECSFIAHATNNLFALIIQLILRQYS